MIAMGLDVSATCTGLVVLEIAEGAKARTPELRRERRIRKPLVAGDRFSRCSEIVETVLEEVQGTGPGVLVIEGYALGRFNGANIVSVEIGTVVRWFLRQHDRRWLEPTPTQLKRFVLGKQGGKPQMVAGVQARWGHKAMNHDTADAYGLACIGLAWAGCLSGLTQDMVEVSGSLKPV